MKKPILSAILLLCGLSALSYSGEPSKLEGPPCPENQAGEEGTGNTDELDEPVFLPRGEYHESNVDLFLPGRGLDVYLERSYRARSRVSINDDNNDWGLSSALGLNWSHNYEMWVDPGFITQSGIPSDLDLYMGNERMVIFERLSGSNPPRYEASDYDAVLDFTSEFDPVYYTTSDNTVYKFHPTFFDPGPLLNGNGSNAGMLDSITDRNGNTVSLTYEPGKLRDRIASVSDGLGNTLTFFYYDDANAPSPTTTTPDALADLLWKVADHSGREVEYKYQFSNEISGNFEIRQLTEVILPAHVAAPGVFDLPAEHARFPNGRSIGYEYYPNGTSFTGLMTKKTDENGIVILENFYTDPLIDDYRDEWSRRVYRQVYAGDTYSHMLTSENGSDIDPDTYDFNFAVWVQKRNGTVVKLVYSPAYPVVNTTNGYRLLSRTDYPGRVPSQAVGKLVWFNETGGPLDTEQNPVGEWNYADTPSSQSSTFTSLIDKKRVNEFPLTKKFEYTDDWNLSKFISPNGNLVNGQFVDGDTVEFVYNTGASDARSRQALQKVISKPHNSSDWITTEYEHDFSFDGVPASCGCGPERFVTAIIDGNGNRTEQTYDVNGNLLVIYHDMPTGVDPSVPDADPENNAAAIERYTYVLNGGGNVATYTHPSSTQMVNGTASTFERVDEFVYYSDTYSNISSRGKLHIERVDKNGEILETVYEYDAIGNVSKITEPDGDVKHFLYNQGRQLVRESHWNDSETVLYAETDYFYDANGNLVIEKVANLDEVQDVVSGNPVITKVYEYDLRDLLTLMSIERGEVEPESISENAALQATAPTGSDWVTQKWVYDANENLTRFEDGEAVRGEDLFNVVTYEYDYRDLLYRKALGAGSPDELLTQYDYDKKKRLIVRVTNPDDPNGESLTEFFDYDGHDRLVGVADPMLNTASIEYDDNHNMLSIEVYGAIDLDTIGTDTQGILYFEELEYDSRNRVKKKDLSVFDFLPGSVTEIQSTEYTYNDDSSLDSVRSPSGVSGVDNTLNYFYDTVRRVARIEDGAGNTTEYLYDADSNLAQIDRIDQSSSGAGSQLFVSSFTYDALDRQVLRADGVTLQNQNQWRYDSRSNVVREIDARLNTTTYDYDGLNRLIATRVHMTADGDGPETDPVFDTLNPELLTTIVYDDSSRVISETDDNGHTTTYGYDAVNRRTSITMPVVGETYLTEYNGNGVASRLTDARGVVLGLTYDLNNRLIKREVDTMAGPTPAGSLIEEFTYDGLGRVKTAVNKLSPVLELTKVKRDYDSRGFVIREIQNVDGAGGFPPSMDRVVNYEFDLADNTTRIVYPHGRDIQRAFDSINRLISIKDHEPSTPMAITDFDYLGGRLEQRIHGNGTQTAYQYNGYELAPSNPNDKGFGRVAGITTTDSGTNAILDDFEFTWDAAQNRTSYKDVGSGMKNRRERLFGYDSSDRLVSTDVDFPDVNTDFTNPTNSGITTYELDGVHNRFSVTGFEEAGAPVGTYKYAASDLPDQMKNNQYTFTPHESGGQWTYLYDENGNMILKAQYNVADFTGDFNLNIQDYSAFLALYGVEDASADLNNDGMWNFLDLSAFLAAYGQTGGIENQHYTYDFRNQLVDIEFKVGSTTVSHTVTNSYDSFARRVTERIVHQNGDIKGLQFVYGCASLWEVIEQIQLAEGATLEKLLTTHVYGLGIDDEVSYRLEDMVTKEDFWAHRDDLNSLTSVTDISGDVKERYEYGDFGKPRMFDPATSDERSVSSVGVVHLYTGRSLVTGTGLFDYRYRVMDPETGRFVQRDPLEYADSMNLYQYATGSPLTRNDPLGLMPDTYEPADGGSGSWDMPEWGTEAEIAQFYRDAPKNVLMVTGGLLVAATASPARIAWAATVAAKRAAKKALAEAVKARARAKEKAKAKAEAKTGGLKKELAEHIKKLRDYRKNPDAHDNKGHLANCPRDGKGKLTKVGKERRKSIIRGRIRGLKNSIKEYRRKIKRLEKQIDSY